MKQEEELLKIMLSAPYQDIDNMIPNDVAHCKKLLDLPDGIEYTADKHYYALVAKMRRKWAQAMIMESKGWSINDK